MKKNYKQPEIWVEKLKTESPILALTRSVTKTAGNTNLEYGGGGSGSARSGENHLWDSEENAPCWDNL